MAPPAQPELDALVTRVLEQLSETPYSCSSLTRLVNGTTNFVFRGILTRPLPLGDDKPVETVIVKYTADFAALNKDLPIDASRCVVEGSILNLLNNLPDGSLVRTPHLYLFDQSTSTQVLQDIPDAVDLKTILVSPTANVPLSQPLATSIGYALGSWLRSFHSWASTQSRDGAHRGAEIGPNEPMRKLKYLVTYGSFIGNLEQFPDVLGDHRKTLEEVKLMAADEFEKSGADAHGDEWGIIHGDFWSGNILISETQTRDEAPGLFVVDWEFVQFGHRAYDLGQMVGDLCERKHFQDAQAAAWAVDAFLAGYGAVADDVAFRAAIHAGVHLITWLARGPPLAMRPAWARERAAGAVKLGLDMVLRGWARDREWFAGSGLAGLFSSR
ncbi:kinase-like domain-containing protein [Durotheca rogersii]|uniref:kinase-like domain-containing protein n=1 Tax=Durotheca rogersii TaxID=419775 RepID=UPI00221E77D1|nr:kinase-like domain-containing protein [Durotheca rogersii]KAI5860079.1 kinase-like domain-containing protein [Durotheca rogersii]